MTAAARRIETPAERFVAPDKLVQLVRPFVGTFREIHRGDGSRLDVRHIMNSIDVSVLDVDAAGLRLLGHDGFYQVIQWSEVRSITVTDGLGEVTYRNAGARFPVWDTPWRRRERRA